MNLRESTMESLIKRYQETKCNDFLECIIEKLLLENFSEEEYLKVFEIDCKAVKTIVISKASAELLLQIMLLCEDEYLIAIIIEKIKNENICLDFNKILEAKSPTLRRCAISQVEKEKLVKHLLKEEDKKLVEDMLKFLENYNISEKEADYLMDSKNIDVVSYASKYATPKKFIETVINNYEFSCKRSILHSLEKFVYTQEEADLVFETLDKNCNFSEEFLVHIIEYVSIDKLVKILLNKECFSYLLDFNIVIKNRFSNPQDLKKYANLLIFSPSWQVRNMFASYASVKKIKEKLKEGEGNDLVVFTMMERLQRSKISQSEFDELFDDLPTNFGKFLLKYVSKNKIMKILLDEDSFYTEDALNVINYWSFTKEDYDILVDSTSYKVRLFAAKNASAQKLFERLFVEEGEEIVKVIEVIINSLEKLKYVPSENELQKFVNRANSFRFETLAYVCKYVSKESLIKMAKDEYRSMVLKLISIRLENEELTESEANKLIDSCSHLIRICAYKYASLDVLVKQLLVEKEKYLILEILKRLDKCKYEFSNEEIDSIITSKFVNVRLFIVDYASKDEILNLLLSEKNTRIVKKCIIKLEEYGGIAVQEANKLLDANNGIVREYAYKFASKDRILEKLTVERNTQCITELISNFN